jgi:cobalt-zinc-cadmium efflux system outer membrane protein
MRCCGTGTTSESDTKSVNSNPPLIGRLALADVFKLVQERNPTIAACAAELRAKDAAAVQAGLAPNPELSFEMENIDGAETTISFSQLIELAGQECETGRLDLLAGAAKAFFAVLTAQEQAALNKELVKLAEQVAAAVGERADAGKVSPVEKSRVQVELAAAKLRLAAFWDRAQPDFTEAAGDLSSTASPPPEEGLQWLFWQEGLIWPVGKVRSNAARRPWWPGFLSPCPLPIATKAALLRPKPCLTRPGAISRLPKSPCAQSLPLLGQNASASCAEASVLRSELLPRARKAYEAAVFGYREGKQDLLQMVDAQRILFQIRRQEQQAFLDIERLTGTLSAVP